MALHNSYNKHGRSPEHAWAMSMPKFLPEHSAKKKLAQIFKLKFGDRLLGCHQGLKQNCPESPT